MRPLIIAATCLSLAACATTTELAEGIPTPALAMYFAQADAATAHCDVEVQESTASRFIRGNSGMYQKKYPLVEQLFPVYRARYEEAWTAADSARRQEFCAGYAREMEELRPFMAPNNVRLVIRLFSPPSEEAIQRGRTIANSLSAGTSVALNAASISASHEGYRASKAGDFPASQHHMAEGRALNRMSGAFTAASTPGTATETLACESQVHFMRSEEPADSQIWMTYRTTQDVLQCAP